MKQCEIWETNLNPVRSIEQAGFRPVLILSGNMLNTYLNVVIVCPLTSKIKNYKGNLIIKPNNENKLKVRLEALTFQIRSILKERLIKKIGQISQSELNEIKKGLDDILRY